MLSSLLPANALEGVRLAVSASDSPDLLRLGLTEEHFRLALGELARLVVVCGGTLAYGGDLRPDGYTQFLVDEVQRYGVQDRDTLMIFLAWPSHREMRLEILRETEARLGPDGRLICLNHRGEEIAYAADRGEAPAPVDDPTERAECLSAMRRAMGAATQGRMIIGGRRHGFSGRSPGLVEESLLTLEAEQPLYLAAGFGGATADIAAALGLPTDWLPPAPNAPEPDSRMLMGLAHLQEAAKHHPLRTGLSETDQTLLAATHRPSEIASLVSLGLAQEILGCRDDS